MQGKRRMNMWLLSVSTHRKDQKATRASLGRLDRDINAISGTLRLAIGQCTAIQSMAIDFPTNLVFLLNLRLIWLGAIVLLLPRQEELEGAAQQAVQPEQIQRLKHSQQCEGDDVGDPALVLLSLPVELVGADGLELV